MTASRVCGIIAEKIKAECSDVEIVSKPLADGGDGTAEILCNACSGKWIPKTVTGPLQEMKVDAGFYWLAESQSALIEMALASGITLLAKEKLNPMLTTTYGTGELIRAALEYKPEKIFLAIGGSATVEMGVGAAMAMGWKFLDGSGSSIGLGGAELAKIEKIIPPQKKMPCPVEVLSDVDNPLCGENGAAKVFGPQKGATPEMVEKLDDDHRRLADLIKAQLGCDVKNLPGAGAAGGLGAGSAAFFGAKIVSGINTIMAIINLENALLNANIVITGEGRFDSQSLNGKVVAGVLELAKRAEAKVIVIAGSVKIPCEEYKKIGIIDAISCMDENMSIDYAMSHSEELLVRATKTFIEKHFS